MYFKINYSGTSEEGFLRLRSIIKSARGTMSGGNIAGSFRIPYLFGELKGSYFLHSDILDVYISTYPVLVYRRRIIKLFEKINRKKTVLKLF